MEFKFHCPHCDQRASADTEDEGALVNCPTCGEAFIIPRCSGDVEAQHSQPDKPNSSLDDLGIIAASHISNGVADVGAELVQEFGDAVKPHLTAIIDRGNQILEKYRADTKARALAEIEKVKANLKGEPPDELHSHAAALSKAHAYADPSLTGEAPEHAETLISLVQADLAAAGHNLTRSETSRAITGVSPKQELQEKHSKLKHLNLQFQILASAAKERRAQEQDGQGFDRPTDDAIIAFCDAHTAISHCTKLAFSRQAVGSARYNNRKTADAKTYANYDGNYDLLRAADPEDLTAYTISELDAHTSAMETLGCAFVGLAALLVGTRQTEKLDASATAIYKDSIAAYTNAAKAFNAAALHANADAHNGLAQAAENRFNETILEVEAGWASEPIRSAKYENLAKSKRKTEEIEAESEALKNKASLAMSKAKIFLDKAASGGI